MSGDLVEMILKLQAEPPALVPAKPIIPTTREIAAWLRATGGVVKIEYPDLSPHQQKCAISEINATDKAIDHHHLDPVYRRVRRTRLDAERLACAIDHESLPKPP